MAKKELKVDLIPAIKKLQVLAKDAVTTTAAGEYKSVFKGKGLEFSDYREYTPADDATLIDWKASSRSPKILVREYIEERDIKVLFALDASSSMLFGSTDKLKVEFAIELVASLSHAMLEAGDSVGICLFSDNVIAKEYPNSGPQQFYNLTRVLLNVDSYGGVKSIDNLKKFILNYMKPSSIIIIVSDFIGLSSKFEYQIKTISARYDLIGYMIRDPRDETLTDGNEQFVITDPNSNQQLVIEPGLLKGAYEQEVKKQENFVHTTFTSNRAQFLKLTTDASFVKPITNFFKRRAYRR